MDDAFERGADAVIVLGRDGVELMVMATGAIDRESEEGAPSRGHHIVKRGRTDYLLGDGILVADVVIGAGHEEGAANLDFRFELADHVTGEVLADQLVERLVVVERADDVVAERIEVIDDEVAFEAVALAEADDVEPVAAPALTVARGGKQAVDEGFGRLAGVGLVGRNESVDFGLGGWESGQVIAEAADQCLRLGRRAAGQFLLGEFGVDEAVDIGVLEIFGEGLE